MGQQNSLNCKNNAKDETKEIQTNQTNALLLMRTLQHKEAPSDSRDKQSTTTWSQVDNNTPLSSSHAQKKYSSTPPQHGNILRVSSKPFRGADKIAGRWVQRAGKSLAQIIEGRYNTNMHFPQSQVVALIESLVYALAYLEKNSIRHHDFYPTNVYYHSGIFKLTNPVSHETSAYTITQQRQRFSFLSPQLIAQIIEQTPAADIPTRIMYKGDLFAIGMIVLQFCTLEQSSQCYDEENYSLVDKIIQSRIAKTAKIYSAPIADCIRQMLNYDVEERISPLELALAVFLHAPSQKVENQEVRSRPQAQQKQPNPLSQPSPQNMQYLQVPGFVPDQQVAPENSVALPAPNYVYSHIGPNNQSLLSGSALQNKLRIIEKIQEKPQEEQDSQGQPSSLTQPSHLSNNSQRMHSKPPEHHHPHLQARSREAQRESPSPQRSYPQPPSQQHPSIQQASIPIQQSPPQPPKQQIQLRPQLPPQIPPQLPPQLPHQLPHQLSPQHPPQLHRIEQRNAQFVPPAGGKQGNIVGVQGYAESQMGPPGFHGQLFHAPLNYSQPPIPFVQSPSELQSKPSSPPLAVRSNFVAPSSEKQTFASGSIKVESFKQEGMNLDDRMLLSQPTFYEIHGNGASGLSRPTQQGGQVTKLNNFTPKLLEGDNYQFSFKQKFGQPVNKSNQYDLPSYKPQSENFNAVADYHSSTSEFNYMPSYRFKKDSFQTDQSQPPKFNTSEEYPGRPTPREPNLGNKYARPKEEGGETLQQRVDRILQISRSIK